VGGRRLLRPRPEPPCRGPDPPILLRRTAAPDRSRARNPARGRALHRPGGREPRVRRARGGAGDQRPSRGGPLDPGGRRPPLGPRAREAPRDPRTPPPPPPGRPVQRGADGARGDGLPPGRPQVPCVSGPPLLPGLPGARRPRFDPPDSGWPVPTPRGRRGRRARARRTLAGPAAPIGGTPGRALGVPRREDRDGRDSRRRGAPGVPRGDRHTRPSSRGPWRRPPHLQSLYRHAARLRRVARRPSPGRTPPLGDARGACPPAPSQSDREGRPPAGVRSG